MRSLTICSLLFCACSNTSITSTTPPDGGQGSVDLSMASAPIDLATVDLSGPQVMCGAQSCAPGVACCVTAGDGGSAVASCTNSCGSGVPIECRDPGYCGGNPCCLTFQNLMPTGVRCTSGSSQCPTMFSGGPSNASGQTRLCRDDNDCTVGQSNTLYPNCCTTTMQGITQKLCFSSQLVALTGGAITCP